MIGDHHVHTEWSWDAERGSMVETCRRAVEIGLPSIAFTEHADWVRGPACVLDAPAYLECVERCRNEFPGLRILTGVELGEPHRFPGAAEQLVAAGFDRVLGSVHVIDAGGALRDASEAGFLTVENCGVLFRRYLGDTLRLVESASRFECLAHLDYPRRYWPAGREYRVDDYEEELRAVLRALARRGGALEVNTTRGRVLCPGPPVLEWWREAGGERVTFGSDAHSPDLIAAGFREAAAMVEAAGFRPHDDPTQPWLRG